MSKSAIEQVREWALEGYLKEVERILAERAATIAEEACDRAWELNR